MKTITTSYEAHIETLEVDWIHITSHGPITDYLINGIMKAVECVAYQYESAMVNEDRWPVGPQLCLQHIADINDLIDGGVTCAETYQDLYMVDVHEFMAIPNDDPLLENTTFAVSHNLSNELRDLMQPNNDQSFDDIILSTMQHEGLTYAIITDSFLEGVSNGY